MPADGVPLQPHERLLTDDEIVSAVSAMAAGGVSRVRLTGGEPLLRRGWDRLAGRIAAVPGVEEVAVTTNAVALGRSGLGRLLRSGVSAVNVSLDTLDPAGFEALSLRPAAGLHRALAAIQALAAVAGARASESPSARTAALAALPASLRAAAAASALSSVKVNAVALRGVTETQGPLLAALAARMGVEVRFIELMPFAGNEWRGAEAGGLLTMEALLRTLCPFLPGMLPDEAGFAPPGVQDAGKFSPHATSRLWRLGDDISALPALPEHVPAALGPGPVSGGRVGVIASMSAPFCGGCNRLRLTADGQLKSCLFGSDEVSLRDAMRARAPVASAGDDELRPREAAIVEAVERSLRRKHRALGGHGSPEELAAASSARGAGVAGEQMRPMITIGG